MALDSGEITRLLHAFRDGDRAAMDALFPMVYDELRASAHGQLRRRRGGQSLDTTALVHDAFLKLIDQQQANWKDRQHFMAVAATAMRHILVDHARRRGAQKRGGDEQRVTFDEGLLQVKSKALDVLALDQALNALSILDPRLGQLVELRFFAGLSVEEIAQFQGVSDRTIKRDWRKARAFLHQTLDAGVVPS